MQNQEDEQGKDINSQPALYEHELLTGGKAQFKAVTDANEFPNLEPMGHSLNSLPSKMGIQQLREQLAPSNRSIKSKPKSKSLAADKLLLLQTASKYWRQERGKSVHSKAKQAFIASQAYNITSSPRETSVSVSRKKKATTKLDNYSLI